MVTPEANSGVTLAGALGVNAARRARAQDELDRIFTLSPDLITVADFDGHFTRVNPAVEHVLGYTKEELLSRPYLELVHPGVSAHAVPVGHDGGNGLLVKPQDPSSLAAGLARAFESRWDAAQIAASVADYTWENLAKRNYAVLEHVLANRNRVNNAFVE